MEIGESTAKKLPCSTKILREFYFSDWRFFLVCGSKFLRFEMTDFQIQMTEFLGTNFCDALVQAAEYLSGGNLNNFNFYCTVD